MIGSVSGCVVRFEWCQIGRAAEQFRAVRGAKCAQRVLTGRAGGHGCAGCCDGGDKLHRSPQQSRPATGRHPTGESRTRVRDKRPGIARSGIPFRFRRARLGPVGVPSVGNGVGNLERRGRASRMAARGRGDFLGAERRAVRVL